MQKYIVLYNPLAQKGHGMENARKLEKVLENAEIRYEDLTSIKDYEGYAHSVPADTRIILTGGDGTLSRFVDAVYDMKDLPEIWYYPAGTGNDFLNDLHREKDGKPFPINEYMHGLPKITINGVSHRFVNAVGFGLDGYCCEEHDRLNALGKERAYTLIALFGLLGKFKPAGAKVTVDGVTKTYKRAWMLPVMFGGYYGGGVLMGPRQDRKNPEHTVTSVAIHDIACIPALFLFLSVCKGRGERYPRYIDYRVGRHVAVEYDRPVALQIDGETVLDVTRFEVEASDEE